MCYGLSSNCYHVWSHSCFHHVQKEFLFISCFHTKFPRKACLHLLYISLLGCKNLTIRSFLRLFSRLNPVSLASYVICFCTSDIFMAFQGMALASWTLYQRSKSEHSILHAVKCVLKSWRILMFLVNLFWSILSLKFCIVFVDLQFLLLPFHILQFIIILYWLHWHTGHVHIKSKLFI